MSNETGNHNKTIRERDALKAQVAALREACKRAAYLLSEDDYPVRPDSTRAVLRKALAQSEPKEGGR